MPSSRELVFDVVRRIPRGKVLSYGQVADLVVGAALNGYMVGKIMAAATPDVPWQRVVARDGALVISKRNPAMASEQRRLLETEGVQFDPQGRVRMDLHMWTPGGTLFDEE